MIIISILFIFLNGIDLYLLLTKNRIRTLFKYDNPRLFGIVIGVGVIIFFLIASITMVGYYDIDFDLYLFLFLILIGGLFSLIGGLTIPKKYEENIKQNISLFKQVISR